MNTTIIIIGLLLAFVTGFFCAIKALHIGLTWKIQTENKQEPILKNPIVEIIDTKKQANLEKYSKEKISEWMYGAGG